MKFGASENHIFNYFRILESRQKNKHTFANTVTPGTMVALADLFL